MRTLLDININVLREYKVLNDLNPDNWDIGEYLNLKYDINAAIAFSKLFFPDFIEKDGCVILAFRYDENNFRDWYQHFNGNVSEIERVCNNYEVMNYFHLNCLFSESHDLYNLQIDEFAKALKKSWEINCKLLFPDKLFHVDVFDEYETTRITMYSVLEELK